MMNNRQDNELNDPPPSSLPPNNNDEEDPTTPKTIHMTRNPFSTSNTNTNSSLYLSTNGFHSNNANANANADSTNSATLNNTHDHGSNNPIASNSSTPNQTNSMMATNGPPRLSLQPSTNDEHHRINNHCSNTNATSSTSATSTTPTSSSTSTRFQRSIPVHRRIHNHNNTNMNMNNLLYSNHGGIMSVTSSTRSVKSVGSSIIDTEDDKSQTGLLSLMSQDYVVDGGLGLGLGLGSNNSVTASVSGVLGNSSAKSITEDVPRVVPKQSGELDDTSIMEDDEVEDDDDTGINNYDHSVEYNENGTRSGIKFGRSVKPAPSATSMGFAMTANIMEKYFKKMQLNLEKGLRDIKEQNRRDNERVMATLQNESNRRAALEGRLHAQILLQSETLIAMEVKLLKLEAKVEKREAALRSRKYGQLINFGGDSGGGGTSNSNRSSLINNDRTGGIGANSGLGQQTSFGLENGTIEEEDVFDMTEIRVNNNSRSRGGGGGLISHSHTTGSRVLGSGVGSHMNPTNIAVISSGASLASGVTATSLLDGLEGHDEHTQEGDDGASGRSADGDVEDEGEEDGSTSTPTQGSRRHFTNLESILLNPIQSSGSNEQALSIRAVRGEYDGNSSLATSVTNTTVASTIITATTGGGGVELANSTSVSQRGEEIDSMLGLSPPTATEIRPSRSRSQSPLTVHSAATASVDPQSVGTIGTSAAVAPARSFRARRDAAARNYNVINIDGGRQITNRVVSFTSNEVLALPPEISEAGDSITMPDELDNLSDVADALADRGRIWRDEYEARLDAIQKRINGE